MGHEWHTEVVVAHSLTDHTQSRWNGLIGAITLQARPLIAIRRHRWQLAADLRTIHLHLSLHNDAYSVATVTVHGQIGSLRIEHQLTLDGCPEQELSIQLDRPEDIALWDDLEPNLHQAELQVSSEHGTHTLREHIGLRHLASHDGQLWINGRPMHLRGTLECAIWPHTGHPPMERREWDRVMITIREHGLNHLRFHSWCPPAAAFAAADEAGVLIQAEAPVWAEIGTWDDTRRFLWDESERILTTYANYASFISLAHGNEPGGCDHKLILHDWLKHVRRIDDSRIYTCASGWPALASNDYHCLMSSAGGTTYTTEDLPMRAHAWNQGANGALIKHDGTQLAYDDAIASRTQLDHGKAIPVVSHEIGQWCAYPDLSFIDRLADRGGVLRADNYQSIADDAARKGLSHLSERFTYASGKLQVACYRAEIEANLATPGMSGFQLLGLQDFPGQGTALVGIVGPEWENKGYHQAAEFARFCGPIVPLARFEHHTHSVGDQVDVAFLIANYSGNNLEQAVLIWELRSHEVIRHGQIRIEKLSQAVEYLLGTAP